MKMKFIFPALFALQSLVFADGVADEDYIVHEWGTFTSVQGADGIQLEWNPLTTTELPSFVYDLAKPLGEPRRRVGQLFGAKTAFRTLQRMETPVLYFYSEQERTVDVTVRFPDGRITEWFPQARDIGPSFVQPRPILSKLDGLANQAGLHGVDLASIDTKKGITNSLIRWADVKIYPAKERHVLESKLPRDPSGSHYYAARETDADVLRVNARGKDSDKLEYEKFLFYRGVGNFKTPLQVSLAGDSDDCLTIRNTGNEA